MSLPKYASIDGEIVEWENAKVHVASAAFKFGTPGSAGARGYWTADKEQM